MNSRTHKKLWWLAFGIYFMVLATLILLKHPHEFFSHLKHLGDSEIQQGKNHMILKPLTTTSVFLSGQLGFWVAFINIGGNIFGFLPLGFVLPILIPKLNNAFKVIGLVFIISLGFELTQFITGVGYCDIDDLTQNTLGGALGYWMYFLLTKKLKPLVHLHRHWLWYPTIIVTHYCKANTYWQHL